MSQDLSDFETAISAVGLLDHLTVDWLRVKRSVYLIHQHLRYEYPGPIDDLNQRLMIIPPDLYGDQRIIKYRLDVSASIVSEFSQLDTYGNRVINLSIPHVERAIGFEAWIVLERSVMTHPYYQPASLLCDSRFQEPSALTAPDEALRRVATKLQLSHSQGFDLAQRINEWVYQHVQYAHEVTDIDTTAAEVLALGKGVCQDSAHLMLALCRLCALPARYVSGHLLGEGGTHAWVEVILPAPDHPELSIAVPFDPTHNCRAGLSYLTIAVGRDYLDVAPTSGTFRAAYRGQLSAIKRVSLSSLEYIDALC